MTGLMQNAPSPGVTIQKNSSAGSLIFGAAKKAIPSTMRGSPCPKLRLNYLDRATPPGPQTMSAQNQTKPDSTIKSRPNSDERARHAMSSPHATLPSERVTLEPFVSADEAAGFLCVRRRFLLELARRGMPGAYALGTGSKRKIWVFRLSELAASVAPNETPIPNPPKPCTIESGSPR